jgi:hypothetical protein
MNEYDFYESAGVRILDRRRFPAALVVEEPLSHNSQAVAHVYRDDNPSAKVLTCKEAREAAAKHREAARATVTVIAFGGTFNKDASTLGV